MTTVAKNIKSFRLEAGVSQETLAEQLHVTRQTISSWETGKNRPDVDTLENISSALGVDLIELIYGRRPKDTKRLIQYQRKYVICTAILAAAAAIGIFVLGLLYPGSLADSFLGRTVYAYTSGPKWWPYFIISYMIPAIYMTFGAFILSAASLKKDIRIKKKSIKTGFAAAFLAFVIIYAVCAAVMVSPVKPQFAQWSIWVSGHPIIFTLPGMMAFAGFNK